VVYCDRWVTVEPDNAAAYVAAGQSLLSLIDPKQPLAEPKRPERALAVFERALELQPSSADALYGRGTVRIRGGDAGGQSDIDATNRTALSSIGSDLSARLRHCGRSL